MATIKKKDSPLTEEVNKFLKHINFQLPDGFIDFFSISNGGELYDNEICIILWPLTDMIKRNNNYRVDEYASKFFIFGSDGGDTAYCIEKKTGWIYEMPFIGMSNEEAIFKYKSFTELLNN
jgi:hypothetical protein